jgi:hypothetical protein
MHMPEPYMNVFTLVRSVNGHDYEIRLDWMSLEELWGVTARIDGQLQHLRQEDGDPWEIMQTALENAIQEKLYGPPNGDELEAQLRSMRRDPFGAARPRRSKRKPRDERPAA